MQNCTRNAPPWGVMLALAALACAPYLVCVRGPWLLDDLPLISLNPFVKRPELWGEIWKTDYWAVRGAPSGVYRPIPMFTFALQYAMSGQWTLPYHIANILLHVVVTLGLWRVLMRGAVTWVALIAAAWFAMHPVHVEAVANVVGRSELLVAVFFVSAMGLRELRKSNSPRRHRDTEKSQRPKLSRAVVFGLEFACWLGVALSKESGLPLLLLPLVEWWVRDRKGSGEKGRSLLLAVAPAFTAGFLYLAARMVLQIGAPALPRSYTSLERVELIASATAKSLQLLSGFFTHRAVWRVPESFGTWLLVFGALGLGALILTPVALLKRRSPAAVPACALALSMLPLLQLYPNTVWVWERGLYVPSLAAAWFFVEATRSARIPRQLTLVAFLAAVVWLGVFARLSTSYSRLYASELRFWTYEHRIDPHYMQTSISYSEALLRTREPAQTREALEIRKQVAAENSASGFAYAALASAQLELGLTRDLRETLTSASQVELQYISPAQRRQGLTALGALSMRAGMNDLAEKFRKKLDER